MNTVFLDTEFTDLLHPELLSIGLVTLDGRELYLELDLNTEAGRARIATSSDFVRYDGVLDMWGRVPGATATEIEMGRRAGEWLLRVAEESGTHVQVAFDYSTDYELLEYAIRDSGLWDRVRKVVSPVNVGGLTGSPEGEVAADECFREQHRRGLARHHALADACALRAAYIAVKAVSARMAPGPVPDRSSSPSFGPTDSSISQVDIVEVAERVFGSAEAARQWMASPAMGLDGQRPEDLMGTENGRRQLREFLGRLDYDVYT